MKLGWFTWTIIIILVFVAFPVLAVITLGFLAALIMGGAAKD